MEMPDDELAVLVAEMIRFYGSRDAARLDAAARIRRYGKNPRQLEMWMAVWRALAS